MKRTLLITGALFAAFFLFGQSAGDIVITEFLADPEGTDNDYEYFEIYNTSNSTIDLESWTLRDNGSDSHVISSSNGTTTIGSGSFLVMCRDGANNSEIFCDYTYTDAFLLANGDDEIVLVNGGTTIAQMTYDDGDEFGDGIAAELININVAKSDQINNGVVVGPDNGSNWQAATSGDNSGFILRESAGAFGNTILPVELLSFSAKKSEEDITLRWQTASEINNSHFELEHSTSGKDFETIAEIEGAGNSVEVQNYSFTHELPATGINHYRLKQVDFDGAFEYSKTVSVHVGTDDEWNLFPTQSRNELTVEWSGDFSAEAISVFDMNGKLVFNRELNDESSREVISTSNLPVGAYILRMQTGRDISSKRFFKVR